MNQSKANIERLLNHSEQVQKEIENHGKSFQESLNNSNFSSTKETIVNKLTGDLDHIENCIKELSKNCLYQLNEWNDLLVGMDIQINEISGLIQRVKSDAGSRLIEPMLEAGNPPPSNQEKEIPQQTQVFNFPDYPFDINTRALDFVGHHIDDVKGNVHLPPLITCIEPSQKQPEFWSKRQDFFLPVFEAKQEKEEYATSFSEFYNFNPAPELQL